MRSIFGAFSILTGFILSYIHWNEFSGGVHGLFNLHGLFFLWIVTFTVTTMHEFSHGMTCRHFGGKVKEGVGKAIGNEQMQVEGMAQQVKGKTQQKVGEAKSTIKDAADKVADKAHEKL